jgi:hypothetical protein
MKELDVKLKEYKEMFDDDFPTFCFMHLCMKEIVTIIEKCLREKSDVYTLGYIEDDSDVKY